QPVGLDEAAQRLARADEVLLADDLVEGLGPEASSEGRLARQPVLQGGAKQVVRAGFGHSPDGSVGRLVARRLSLLVALLLGVSCSSDKAPFLAPAQTTTVPSPGGPPSTTSAATGAAGAGGAPGDVTLTVTDLRLVNSEESDNAFRALVDSSAPDLTVRLT